jgi:hypothetical protein
MKLHHNSANRVSKYKCEISLIALGSKLFRQSRKEWGRVRGARDGGSEKLSNVFILCLGVAEEELLERGRCLA